MSDKLLFEEESYKIIGACIAVHNKLGNGFEEEVYKQALALELNQQNIPFAKEKKLDVFYDGLKLNNAYVAPFICYNKILLEVRSLEELQADQRRQSINTLKATNLPLCLLINFGGQSLTWKRLIHSAGV